MVIKSDRKSIYSSNKVLIHRQDGKFHEVMAPTHPIKSYTIDGSTKSAGDGTYSSNKVLYTIDGGLSINRIALLHLVL
jgi:hypothetical protein